MIAWIRVKILIFYLLRVIRLRLTSLTLLMHHDQHFPRCAGRPRQYLIHSITLSVEPDIIFV